MNLRCSICNEAFGPRGLPIHMVVRHDIHPQRGKGRLNARMREAIRDLVLMMPPDRFALLRPETNATIDRVLGSERAESLEAITESGVTR